MQCLRGQSASPLSQGAPLDLAATASSAYPLLCADGALVRGVGSRGVRGSCISHGSVAETPALAFSCPVQLCRRRPAQPFACSLLVGVGQGAWPHMRRWVGLCSAVRLTRNK